MQTETVIEQDKEDGEHDNPDFVKILENTIQDNNGILSEGRGASVREEVVSSSSSSSSEKKAPKKSKKPKTSMKQKKQNKKNKCRGEATEEAWRKQEVEVGCGEADHDFEQARVQEHPTRCAGQLSNDIKKLKEEVSLAEAVIKNNGVGDLKVDTMKVFCLVLEFVKHIRTCLVVHVWGCAGILL